VTPRGSGSLGVLIGVLAACGSPPVERAPGPPAAAPSVRIAQQRTSPLEQDMALFARATKKQLGDVDGTVQLRNDGILIHPGATTPTSVTFRLGGEINELRVSLFISPLTPEGTALPDAGTVGVRLLADGRELLKASVDRNVSIHESIDLTNVQNLEVRVDNGANGKPWYDWLVLSVDPAM
jgi:hypothetical protein